MRTRVEFVIHMDEDRPMPSTVLMWLWGKGVRVEVMSVKFGVSQPAIHLIASPPNSAEAVLRRRGVGFSKHRVAMGRVRDGNITEVARVTGTLIGRGILLDDIEFSHGVLVVRTAELEDAMLTLRSLSVE